jgi:hypothetical protein
MRLFPAFVLVLTACGPATRTTILKDKLPAPKPADAPIRVYTEQQRPACPFEELAVVAASDRAKPAITEDDLLESLREQARKVGGDAIAGLSSEDRLRRVSGHPEATYSGLVPTATTKVTHTVSGTVVRFTDPKCDPAR